eukprot:440460-Prymnesium_polylepis.1
MIFKTFRCESIEYAPGDSRRYLAADVHLSCDSEEYATTRGIALVMVAVWPIGTPLLYALLLWISRDALLTRKPTQLSRAIAFLSDDCISAVIRTAAVCSCRRLSFVRIPVRTDDAMGYGTFWWEPLEMFRKLIVTGFVLVPPLELEVFAFASD